MSVRKYRIMAYDYNIICTVSLRPIIELYMYLALEIEKQNKNKLQITFTIECDNKTFYNFKFVTQIKHGNIVISVWNVISLQFIKMYNYLLYRMTHCLVLNQFPVLLSNHLMRMKIQTLCCLLLVCLECVCSK